MGNQESKQDQKPVTEKKTPTKPTVAKSPTKTSGAHGGARPKVAQGTSVPVDDTILHQQESPKVKLHGTSVPFDESNYQWESPKVKQINTEFYKKANVSASSSGISSATNSSSATGSSTRSNTNPRQLSESSDDGNFQMGKRKREKSILKHEKLIVAAIDFGTTFSGYAYCTRTDYKEQTPKIIAKAWSATTYQTEKAPTCVLLNKDKSVRSFGYEANSEYQEFSDDDDDEEENKDDGLRDCYFFKHFKMKLFTDPDLSKDRTKLRDESGKFLPAIEVFSAVIKHFMELLLKDLQKKDSSIYFDNQDIHWVLTVPAIWNLKAKQFMREAAYMAGIETDQLTLALEPEAASLYCRKVPNSIKTEDSGSSIASFPVGSKYLIVDLGGGTLDITAHEVLTDNGLRELHQASGGYWGGQRVNENFINFLTRLCGNDVLSSLREDHPSNWQELIDEFERKKCAYNPETTEVITLHIPVPLMEEYESVTGFDLGTALKQTTFARDLTVVKDKLRLKKNLFETFFQESVDNVIGSVERILKEEKLRGLSTILLVGGYAECLLMQTAVRKKFNKYRIIIPENPRVSVLFGAVVYGYEPEVIQSRVSRYTYGIAQQRVYIPGEDDPNNIRVYNNKKFVDNVFDKHVEVGQVLKLHEFLAEKAYYPIDDRQRKAWLEFYASDEKNPQFITEDSCTCIGYVEVELSERKKGVDATILVRINVSGTDIEVEATEKATGKKTNARCDFLG